MKLFVWDGVFVDYTSGIAFALATDADEARRLVADAYIDRYGGKIGDAEVACRTFADFLGVQKSAGLARWSGLAQWHEHLRRVVMDELSGEPRVYETLHGEFLEGGG